VNSVPFWWLVRRSVDGKAGYYDAANTAWFAHQAWGEPFLSREDAEETAKSTGEPSARAVRVHARIPEPKLPAWVKPVAFQYQHVQVWRQHRPGAWTQYVFYVSTAADLSVKEAVVHPRGAAPWGASDVVSAPVDVWTEAAQRAAKMLRARKAAR
jgi:hypothetical protein